MKVPSYLVSSPIPWDKEQNFEPNSFDEILNQLMGQSCDGLYLFGTSGEGYAVSENEFSEIVAQFAETSSSWSGYRQVGCFGLSTSQIKWKCKVCEELNIKQIQITLPFWKELTDDELDIFFSELCGEFQDLEFLQDLPFLRPRSFPVALPPPGLLPLCTELLYRRTDTLD